jgi:hypothetical protein
MSDTIALMWDCNGLEAAVNVTDISKQRVWAALQGKDLRQVPAEPNLMHWRLRAQANPQRHYEIYLLEVEEGITVEDVRVAFEADPQEMADTVRRIGHQFYSDRAREDVKIR